LADERAQGSTPTHRQALAALLFFYGKVLFVDLLPLPESHRCRIQGQVSAPHNQSVLRKSIKESGAR
jgi:hypothetical protein